MDSKPNNKRPYFDTLRNAVGFILKCLDKNDAETLIKACEIEPNETDDFPEIFKDLKDLRTLLENEGLKKDFPKDETTFKIGGHSDLSRHIHIDFHKEDGKWYLYSIWRCK